MATLGRSHESPANPHLLAPNRHPELGHRTQEVVGSSPASSIAMRLHDGAFSLDGLTGGEEAGAQVNFRPGGRQEEERQMAPAKSPRRVRVERGIYRQPNGKYAVCARHADRLHFRTVGHDIEAARRAREELVTALAAGRLPASPRLRFDTVAGWWLERFEAKVAVGERHPRTLEAHHYHLEHNLLPHLASRRIAALGVEDVAALITELRGDGRSAKSTANALGTLQGILRFARRRGWVLTDPVELLEPEERPRHPRRRQRVLGRTEIDHSRLARA